MSDSVFADVSVREILETLFKAEVFEHWCAGKSTFTLHGYGYDDPGVPGKFKIHAVDNRGRTLRGGAFYDDAQIVESGIQLAVSEQVLDERTDDEKARDTSLDLAHRIESLYSWVSADSESAAAYVLAQIMLPQDQSEWRNALIFAAEDTRFTSESDQRDLAKALHDLAAEMRDSPQANDELAVYSAIRRYASLIEVDELPTLVEFLTQGSEIDTRLVASQSVSAILERSLISGDRRRFMSLADRLYVMIDKLVDSDVLTPGELSAIAEEAICALAALSDPRIDNVIARLASLDWPWFMDQLRSRVSLFLNESGDAGLDADAIPHGIRELEVFLRC
jgi:hypothetical protein